MIAERAAQRQVATGPLLTVDLDAVAGNVRRFVETAGASGAEVMAVVKADGFGHGAVEVARVALTNGATWLGVTSAAEALELRAAGLSAPLLSWLNPVDADFAELNRGGVDVAVADLEHLAAVAAAGGQAPPRVHLHLDTGMARDGAAPQTWFRLCREARAYEQAGRLLVVGVMGHLSCADDPADGCNIRGRARFARGVHVARGTGLRPWHRHLAATAATLTDRRTHHTMVRIGAGLVGIDPSGTRRLRGAVRLTAPVVSVRQARAGARVGYGHGWVAPRSTSLALLPVGYADGLPRVAEGRAEVQIAGRRHRIVGRISMDQVVVDLGPASTVGCGEQAVLIGPGDDGEPTAADWADWAGTIEHEIVTGLTLRTRRTHVGGGPRGLR